MSSLDSFLLLELPMSPGTQLDVKQQYFHVSYCSFYTIDATSHYTIVIISIMFVTSAAISNQNVATAASVTEGA